MAIVIVDGVEYDVPEAIAEKVNEAIAYRAFSGGLSPSELLVWILELGQKMEHIDKSEKEILAQIKDIAGRFGIT